MYALLKKNNEILRIKIPSGKFKISFRFVEIMWEIIWWIPKSILNFFFFSLIWCEWVRYHFNVSRIFIFCFFKFFSKFSKTLILFFPESIQILQFSPIKSNFVSPQPAEYSHKANKWEVPKKIYCIDRNSCLPSNLPNILKM